MWPSLCCSACIHVHIYVCIYTILWNIILTYVLQNNIIRAKSFGRVGVNRWIDIKGTHTSASVMNLRKTFHHAPTTAVASVLTIRPLHKKSDTAADRHHTPVTTASRSKRVDLTMGCFLSSGTVLYCCNVHHRCWKRRGTELAMNISASFGTFNS